MRNDARALVRLAHALALLGSSEALGLSPAFAQEPAPSELPTYGATARVAEPTADEVRSVDEPASVRLHEHLGPSFSFAESMPGAVPVFSGVPYIIVRGAPPSGTRAYYDGVPVPTLFHVALMPAIVSPRLMGGMTLYPAVAPARHGRKLGGALVVDGPTLDLGAQRRELSLSLLDASGYLQTPVDERASVAAAWRVGNPGLALAALGLDARLAYYDYQLRFERRFGAGERLIVLGLGAGDRLGEQGLPDDDMALDFQRLLVRYTRGGDGVELGSEIMLGFDASTLGQELDSQVARIAPGAYLETRSTRVRARIGAQLSAALISLDRGVATSDSTGALLVGDDDAGDLTLDPQDFLDQAPLADVPTRSMFGVYGELELLPTQPFSIELGLRADAYAASDSVTAGLDPSARLSYRIGSAVSAHAALALAHSPVTSPIPIPGLDEIAFDRGLSRALQSEAGVRTTVAEGTFVDATLFYQRFIDTVYLELILDCQGNTNPEAAQAVIAAVPMASSVCTQQRLPRATGETYGAELYFERDLTQRLSGFLSYTLSFAGATAEDDTRFTPQSDVRHIANAVLQYDLGAGFEAGMRLHARSGKMGVNTIFDVPAWRFERFERRLPGFFRADLRVSYHFRGPTGPMEASISWLNVTMSREATNHDCTFNRFFEVECRVDYQPAIVLPNVALRGEL